MSLRQRCIGLVLTTSILVPAIAGAQGPWNVTVFLTMNPLPVGFCAAVHLKVFDASGKEVPRDPLGFRVTMADFDIAVTTPDRTSAVAQQIDASHWKACACQGAPLGTVATVTATYPAQTLAAPSRVPGVAFQRTATFALSAPKGTSNPTGCGGPAVVASSAGAAAPAPQPPPTAVLLPPVSPPLTLAPGAPAAGGAVPASAAATGAAGASGASGNTAGARGAAGGAVAPPAPTAPVPINPTGFAAVQTAPGQVQLSWQPVSGASYYVLLGPGVPNGGTKVSGATTFTATAVPTGSQQWAVASYYDPGPVSTPAAEFPRVTLNVTSPTVSGPAPPPSVPTTGRYRMVATGFRVVKETYDDQLDRDGLRNEVYGAFAMFHSRSGSEYELLDRDLRRTLVHGDVLKHPGRVQAGSASMTGGLREGDAFPSDPSIRVGPIGDQSFPFSVWEGSLTDETDFAIIYPTLWEWSGSEASYDYWFANLLSNAPAMWSAVKDALSANKIVELGVEGAAARPSQSFVDRAFSSIASTIAAASFGLLDFSARDRPIGLKWNAQGTRLLNQALLLTRRGVEGSLITVGSSRLSLTIPFVDDPSAPRLGGSYILYLQVERVP
ncbi:MAG: hypothetical protein M3068_07735 [Gemmatimonadota bacterium]|nr:hypothetical protein [Gemmatimonadota bacterium]